MSPPERLDESLADTEALSVLSAGSADQFLALESSAASCDGGTIV